MSAWICYCSLHETKSLNMFSRHWKTVMFGFAPKQCFPSKRTKWSLSNLTGEHAPTRPP